MVGLSRKLQTGCPTQLNRNKTLLTKLMITENDFSNLTLLSYPRGQMGEYFFLNLNGIESSKFLSGANQYITNYVDKSLECVTHNHMRENTNAIKLARKFFGKSVFELIESKSSKAPLALLFFIRLFKHVNYNIEEYYRLVAEERWDDIYLLGTNPTPIDDTFTFKAVTRGNINFTKVFHKLNQIQFYCPPDKIWIFVTLYFSKTIYNKEFINSTWMQNNLNFKEYFKYVWENNKNTPLDGTININTYDIITNTFIDPIFKNHKDINEYCKKNLSIIENLNLDIDKSYDERIIFDIIEPLYTELINGMGRSSSDHMRLSQRPGN